MKNIDYSAWVDDEEPDNGFDLREDARQAFCNAFDMLSLSADFWGDGLCAIVVAAPRQLGADRFKAAVDGLAAHVQSKSLPRWTIGVEHDRNGEDLRASLVLLPAGLFPVTVHDAIDFLGGLGVRPED